MANLHRFTVQEAVNTDSAGVWDIGSATTVAGSAINAIHGTDAKDISGYHTVGLTTNQPIYFRFTGTTTDACASTDLKLEIGTHFLKIPHGIGSNIYLNMLRVSSTATVNIVLI
jgi:hypothetical protein